MSYVKHLDEKNNISPERRQSSQRVPVSFKARRSAET